MLDPYSGGNPVNSYIKTSLCPALEVGHHLNIAK